MEPANLFHLAPSVTKAWPPSGVEAPKAWRTLSTYLPSRDVDSDFWWSYCGLHLAIMLEEAEYPMDKQLEALTFWYSYGAPYMGKAPSNEARVQKWKSLVQPDGTPIEYSWKWPQAGGKHPEVRYDFEPIGKDAGTALDPLCQQAAKELMGRLAEAIPGVNNTWFNHFMSTLFEHDNTKMAAAAARGEPMTSTALMAAEFLPKGVTFKTYIQPRLAEYPILTPTSVYEASLAGIDGESKARATVHEYLNETAEGRKLKPFSLGVDHKNDSRLKWYFMSPSTSFTSVREIMTLNGRVKTPHIERQLANLHDLIKGVLGLPDDFPETEHPAKVMGAKPPYVLPPPPPTAEDPTPGPVMPGYPYYFDLATDQEVPAVKLGLPVRNYPRKDVDIAKAFCAWMEKQGRGAYCERYMSMLSRLAITRGTTLEESRGLQAFITIMMRPDGLMDVTTYYSSQAFDDYAREKNAV